LPFGWLLSPGDAVRAAALVVALEGWCWCAPPARCFHSAGMTSSQGLCCNISQKTFGSRSRNCWDGIGAQVQSR
jgi:hypothetical protein